MIKSYLLFMKDTIFKLLINIARMADYGSDAFDPPTHFKFNGLTILALNGHNNRYVLIDIIRYKLFRPYIDKCIIEHPNYTPDNLPIDIMGKIAKDVYETLYNQLDRIEYDVILDGDDSDN